MIQVFIERRQGYVITATSGARLDNGLISAHSVRTFALPHRRAVLSGLGTANYLSGIHHFLNAAPTPSSSLDDLADHFGSICLRVWHAMGRPELEVLGPVALVGWSERAKSIIGRWGLLNREEDRFEVLEMRQGLTIAPQIDFTTPEIRKLAVPGSFIAVAKQQHDFISRNFPSLRPGGQLILTTITFSAIEQRSIFTWPEEPYVSLEGYLDRVCRFAHDGGAGDPWLTPETTMC